MKEKRTKKIIALLTSTTILTSSCSFFYYKQFSVEKYYQVNKDNCSVSNNYQSYSKTLVDDRSTIPYFENMVPQGLTSYNDYYLISYYDATYNNKSTIVTMDKENNIINLFLLCNKAHVGGIFYDKINDLLWVCGENGCIDIYNIYDVINKKEELPLYKDVDVGEDLVNYKNVFVNSVSYLTIYDNKLFVGSFSLYGNGIVKEYLIKHNTLEYVRKFKVPDKVQGLAFYNKDGNDYILFSRSYSTFPSIIQIFKYDEEIDNYCLEKNYVYYIAPDMLEQISVDENNLLTLYESSADIYKTKSHNVCDKICVSNCDWMVESLSLNKSRL